MAEQTGFQHKEGWGSIFKNDFKTEGDNKPSYKGKMMVNGKVLDVALWVKKSEGGKSYFSIKVEEPYSPQPNNSTPPPPAGAGAEDESDGFTLPF